MVALLSYTDVGRGTPIGYSRSMAKQSTRAAPLVVLVTARLLGPSCSCNKFVSQEDAVKAQWAQVQNQLQRRNDLIPNLVETVKGYATHESQVFEDIAASRAKLAGATTQTDQIAAANQQSQALGRLLVIVE